MEQFINPVKESVFFSNRYVPHAIVEENQQDPIYTFDSNCYNGTLYSNDFPASKENRNVLQCIPCSSSNVTACVIKQGERDQSFVFKVESVHFVVSFRRIWYVGSTCQEAVLIISACMEVDQISSTLLFIDVDSFGIPY